MALVAGDAVCHRGQLRRVREPGSFAAVSDAVELIHRVHAQPAEGLGGHRDAAAGGEGGGTGLAAQDHAGELRAEMAHHRHAVASAADRVIHMRDGLISEQTLLSGDRDPGVLASQMLRLEV